ncbi:transcriptional regulator [Erwinia sp. HR93]|uniref:transcriptional regulator n=1 Tax=Erwinia sp. HR93 TaxID=3094840 RepID=UPI002ADEFA8B|nr:transcriptional regulator [Erwinia sp. HR93]MEA1063300.1 transcriptional regulator [Erwinia sp. HR93]
MQREDVLEQALQLLERNGLASTTLDMVAEAVQAKPEALIRFWPDREALLYDALRYHSQQIDAWRHKLIHDDTLNPQRKLLARYDTLTECVANSRYPGCLFIAACSFFPDGEHPIHQLATHQKRVAREYTHALLSQLDVDDPSMVAEQMELVLEGCLSRLLVNRSAADIDTARRLAEDILRLAQCRTAGALT